MNIFHIIGPVMIGPSSSHTAGAVRLGRVANKIMNEEQPASLRIELSGSFAYTYQGHGTDRALLAGIMGYHSDAVEIRDAINIARNRGIDFTFVPTKIPNTHPNTVRIHFRTADGQEGSVMGASIGGGNIRVDEVNDMRVDFSGDHCALLVLHRDVPGVIADVTNMLRDKYDTLNIAGFRLSRKEKGKDAIMTIEFDENPPDSLKSDLKTLPHILNTILIRAI